jgi:hypothetical protein
MATERQQPVTVHVGSVQSAPAKATWRALEKQGYDVKWSDEGPSVTFKPQAKPAVKLPADIFEGITGKKPAISTPSLIETYHGMVNRALTPESIDIADHEWQQ